MIGPRTEVPSDHRCSTVFGGHSGHRIAVLCAPRNRAQAGCGEAIYKQPPDPALPPSGRLYTTSGREVVKAV
ncbi:unnamed protein product, partial [Staurois parvus]